MVTEAQEVPKPPIFEIPEITVVPDEYVSKKVDLEGGLGAIYDVPISSWKALRAEIMGHGYDIDGLFGWQCWDGTALLWQQLGLALLTGNGYAIGCWTLKRNVNKYNKFDLITDINKLKLGDVVVMTPNHIGFFDGFDGAYMRIVGQNQGGKPGKNGGAAFNVARITKSAFAGAFRLKKWHVPKPKPKPAPKPKPKPPAGTYRLKRAVKGYISSTDAKNRKNPRNTVKAGNYYIFNKANGMINVTSKKGVPGSWINPGDNK